MPQYDDNGYPLVVFRFRISPHVSRATQALFWRAEWQTVDGGWYPWRLHPTAGAARREVRQREASVKGLVFVIDP